MPRCMHHEPLGGFADAFIRAIIAPALTACLTGCLYTTHHFNSGRILDPGQTAVTIGIGRSSIYSQGCPDGYGRDYDTTATAHPCAPYFGGSSARPVDTAHVPEAVTSITIPKFSLGYRLGVRGPWGPFTGVEMGWHLEALTNPGTVEFDLKFGLPVPEKFHAHHSLSGGWGVGMWADNSWFLEYAASRDLGKHAVYGNYRYTWLATQPADLTYSFDHWRFVSHRNYAHQAALGLYLKLPDIFLVPDYVTPQVNFTFPVTAPFIKIDQDKLESVLVNINFGCGWNF